MYLIKSFKEDVKNLFRFERSKKIVCCGCGKVQALAIDWEYQKCSCGNYLYDYR